jgi:hypothetical protein
MTQLIDPFKRSLTPRHTPTPEALGARVEATVIAGTTTPVPQGQGNFDFLTFPQVSSVLVAFQGAGKGQPQNLYTSAGGKLALALAVGAAIPSTGGKFTGFGLPTPAQGAIAVVGVGSQGTAGVYVKSGELLTRIADTTTPVPGGAGSFTSFREIDFDAQGAIAFAGTDASGAFGVYASSFPGHPPVGRIADTRTPIPGSAGSFDFFGNPTVSDAGVAFFAHAANSPAGTGLFFATGGALRAVASLKTPVPNAAGTFNGFGSPVMSGDTVAFHAEGTNGSDGIYTQTGSGPLAVVADLATPVPGGQGTFQSFSLNDPSIDGANVAFLANYETNKFGIFARVQGKLVRVLTSDDTLNGAGILNLGISLNQLSQGVLAFYAVTGPGVFGIYTLPLR